MFIQFSLIDKISHHLLSFPYTGISITPLVSERLGKTLQDRESISINSNDTSISHPRQLEMAVPLNTISGLSSGEFVCMVADNPDEIIELQTFHAMVVNDHDALKREK